MDFTQSPIVRKSLLGLLSFDELEDTVLYRISRQIPLWSMRTPPLRRQADHIFYHRNYEPSHT